MTDPAPTAPRPRGELTLFLGGDLMIGRGVDRILRTSADPAAPEGELVDAAAVVRLAEAAAGPISRGVGPDYVWGDAASELERAAPDLRIVNLETALTTSDDAAPGRIIHFRAHPANVEVLRTARIDACALANNHVLDWGRTGLTETLATLRGAGIRTAGAGRDVGEAAAPAVLEATGRRVLLFSYASPTAGVPLEWSARPDRPGVCLTLESLGAGAARRVVEHVARHRREGDTVVASIHWGPNWGYEVTRSRRAFAHHLVESGAVDVVHGHSSHHPLGLEIHRGRLILYGSGELLDDYEYHDRHREYRGELVLAYLPVLAPSGRLLRLTMLPFRIHRFRLRTPSTGDVRWLADTLDRESRKLGTRVGLDDDGRLSADPL